MKIKPFELERWQSVWENIVELNISESGVTPLTVAELLGDPAGAGQLLQAKLGYPQSNGSEETRAGVARLYPGATAANVLVTCGGSEANYVTSWALVEPGDEVIFMVPNYMQVIGVAEAFGGTIKPLWLREESRWAPDMDDLRKLLTPKTKLICICNPNNPTGAVLTEKTMDEICAAASKVGSWVLADEIYRGAELEGDQVTPTFWGRYERVICTNGFSKAYGMPGLRTGWVAGPAGLVEKIWGYHDYTSIGPSMLSDRLTALALEPARHARIIERTRQIVRSQYPILREWIDARRDVFTHVPPAAGAIATLGYKAARPEIASLRSDVMAEELRAKKSVLIVAGTQFGLDGYIRIGFGYNAEVLRRALDRISEWLAEKTESAAVAR